MAAGLALAIPAGAAAQAPDRAIVLDGAAYVDFGNAGGAFDLVPGGQRTFALWLRYERPEFHAKILDTRGSSALGPRRGLAIFVHQYSGSLGVWVDTGAAEDTTGYPLTGAAGGTRIADGRWHHVAVVQEDTLLRGFVNGRLDFEFGLSAVLGRVDSEEPLLLGWNRYDRILFQGEVDELTIWSRALSRREIRHLMFHSPTGTEPGLVAYWPMDDGVGDLVRDRGPLGLHGRAYGAAWAPATRPTAPPFRETPGLFALVALLVLAVFYAAVRLGALRAERQKRRLEGVVAERTRELAAEQARTAEALGVVEAQARRLAELDEAKNRFFTNISHEFRTPLSLVIGPLSDIRDGRLGPVDDAMRRHVAGALRNGRRLLRLTRQLLDLARLETGALRLTVYQLDLGALLEGLALAYAPAAERHAIRFECTLLADPLRVWGDPLRLETAFSNLLSNAVKFTEAGGTVRLVARATGHGVEVRVEDTGPGIDAADIERVFERFYQTEVGRRQGQGSGIGLALARELIELHGGDVRITSQPGSGAVFTVRLRSGRTHLEGAPQVAAIHEGPPPAEPPIAADGAHQVRPPAPAAADLGDGDDAGEDADRPVVLVVDDNAEIRAYVRSHLEGEYRVDEAADGAAALERARACVPDLVVADVMMAGTDGLELLRALRADPDLDFVPVIILTARAELHDRLEGLGHGADDYLTKPFEPAELSTRIANLIAQRKRLRERLLGNLPGPAPGSAEVAADSADDGLEARLRAVIEQRLGDEDFGVDALAAAVYMERTGLYRHMVDELGTTPSDFLREIRLTRAAELLREGPYTVAEVAYAVGYRSVSSFGRRFRDRYGCTPVAWAGGAPHIHAS